jgi:hypothetical protein
MVEIVWEYTVKKEACGRFELLFGPGGAWSNLFARSAGFRGTTLMRDLQDAQRYLVIEIWNDETDRERSINEQQGDYANLEKLLVDWTKSIIKIGIFSVLAEGTIRPRGKSGRRRG